MRKIEETIRKLLRLAASSNVNEAANAAKRAQHLMEKHRIEVSLEKDAEEAFVFDEPLDVFQRKVEWKGHLADAICEANGCKGMWTRRGANLLLVIAGPQLDCDAVRYLYRYLVEEITRLCSEAAKRSGPVGTNWRNSFRYGAITIITLRLREATEDAWDEVEDANPAALAVIEKRMVQADGVREWVEDQVDVDEPADHEPDVDFGAFNEGMRAAQSISLDVKDNVGDGRKTAGSDG